VIKVVLIKFLGACREVGRSGVLIESEQTSDKFIIDYGIKMEGIDENFPEHVSGKDLKGIIITHSHIDHIGGAPIFYISGNIPLYINELTLEISDILLRDMLSISEFYMPFEKEELIKMRRNANFIYYNKRIQIGQNSYLTIYNAGHIPGSAMVLLEIDNKRILYTGDFNLIPTELVNPAEPIKEEIDFLISECTYGATDHEPRPNVEKDFISNVLSILNNNGKVLIPAFGVARSQEVLMILQKYQVNFPIFFDGMARRIARVYETFPNSNYFRDYRKMVNCFKLSHFILQTQKFLERENVKSTIGIIIAPSGMLKGGAARLYADYIINDPNSAIYLVSFQLPGTPGDILLKENKYISTSKKGDVDSQKVYCKVKYFDFSSHSGKTELLKFIDSCKFKNDNKQMAIVHGDEQISIVFQKELENKNYNCLNPRKGDVIKI